MICMGADNVLPDWKIKLAGKGEYRVGQMCGVEGTDHAEECIRSRRTELCLSQEVLAEKVGISTNTVSGSREGR